MPKPKKTPTISPISPIDRLIKKDELGQPFTLMDHPRDILRLAFAFDENGRLPWDTILYSCVKKFGKNDGTGLNRWPVCPNRRSAPCAAIRVGLRSADLTDSILRNVDAVKEALRKEVELIADGCPLPPTVIVPPLPQKEIPTRVESRHNPLRH